MSLSLSKDSELINAAKEGKLDKVVELIMLGANINAKDSSNSWTPLHYACMNGHLFVVDYLVLKNADLNAKNFGNKTPLEVAQLSRHHSIVEYLEEHFKSKIPINGQQPPSSPRNNDTSIINPSSSNNITSNIPSASTPSSTIPETSSSRSSLTLTASPSQTISSMNQVLYSSSPKSSTLTTAAATTTTESEEKKKSKKKMTLFSSKTLKGTSSTTVNLTSSKFNESANETILFLQTQLAEATKEKNSIKFKVAQLQEELDNTIKKLQLSSESKQKQEEKFNTEIEKWKMTVKLMEQQKQNLQDSINEKNMLLETSFQVNVIMQQKELIESLRKQLQAISPSNANNNIIDTNPPIIIESHPPQKQDEKDISLERVEKMLSKVKHIRSHSKSFDLPNDQLKEIAKSIDTLLKTKKQSVDNFDELLEDVDL